MLDAIEKMRKVLTLNKETDLDIESLIDDFDLHMHITRKSFETSIQFVLKDFE